MMFFIFILLGFVHLHCAIECDSPQVYCISDSTYSVNIFLYGEVINLPLVLNCPENYYCHDDSTTPCQDKLMTTTVESTSSSGETETEPTSVSTTIKPISTTPSSTTTIGPPTCNKEGFHRAQQCNQYYECIRALWWYDVKLRTCKSGLYYSISDPPCSKPPSVVCTN